MKNTILRKISLIVLIAVTLGFSSNIYAELGIVEEGIKTVQPNYNYTSCSLKEGNYQINYEYSDFISRDNLKEFLSIREDDSKYYIDIDSTWFSKKTYTLTGNVRGLTDSHTFNEKDFGDSTASLFVYSTLTDLGKAVNEESEVIKIKNLDYLIDFNLNIVSEVNYSMNDRLHKTYMSKSIHETLKSKNTWGLGDSILKTDPDGNTYVEEDRGENELIYSLSYSVEDKDLNIITIEKNSISNIDDQVNGLFKINVQFRGIDNFFKGDIDADSGCGKSIYFRSPDIEYADSYYVVYSVSSLIEELINDTIEPEVEEKIEDTIKPTVKETETCSEDKCKFDGMNEFELFGEVKLTNKEICGVNAYYSFLDVVTGNTVYFNTSKDLEKNDFVNMNVKSNLTYDEYKSRTRMNDFTFTIKDLKVIRTNEVFEDYTKELDEQSKAFRTIKGISETIKEKRPRKVSYQMNAEQYADYIMKTMQKITLKGGEALTFYEKNEIAKQVLGQ